MNGLKVPDRFTSNEAENQLGRYSTKALLYEAQTDHFQTSHKRIRVWRVGHPFCNINDRFCWLLYKALAERLAYISSLSLTSARTPFSAPIKPHSLETVAKQSSPRIRKALAGCVYRTMVLLNHGLLWKENLISIAVMVLSSSFASATY